MLIAVGALQTVDSCNFLKAIRAFFHERHPWVRFRERRLILFNYRLKSFSRQIIKKVYL